MEQVTCKRCSMTKPLTAEHWTYNTNIGGAEFSTWICRTCWNEYHLQRKRAKKAAFIGPPTLRAWKWQVRTAERQRHQLQQQPPRSQQEAQRQ